jgi:hypothetical protein
MGKAHKAFTLIELLAITTWLTTLLSMTMCLPKNGRDKRCWKDA